MGAHARNVAAQGRAVLHRFKPVLSSRLPVHVKLGIYKAYIRPVLLYAAPAWFALTCETEATHSTKEREGIFEEARASEKTCPVCQGEHFLRDCQKFLKASVQDRWALVKKSRVCFRCLQGRHRKENCRKPPCKECKRWHHHLLHAGPEERTSAGNEDTQRGASSIMASVNAVNNARAYLKIVPVEVFGDRGPDDVPDNFDQDHRWFAGPEFLKKEEVDWPAPRSFKKETTGEEKTVDVVATASTRHPSPDPERFSSWKRLWRATARVLQFIQLCRKKKRSTQPRTTQTGG
ncbi:hypothetical protein PYW07_013232 [Mythimna separata]|uniref:CCHC-type domain-containing protein n=1 Tax=Mythimna separata TaxID=271217 RepID=A0AAD7Y631_MYTSE|nr:hypothetical protein PYW07_013232 [Mythimna separata]